MEKKDQIGIWLDSIQELTCHIADCGAIQRENLGVQFKVLTKVNRVRGIMKMEVGTRYVLSGETVLTLELLFTFRISNMDQLLCVDKENRQLTFKRDVVPTFINIAMGGLRGVLYEKTKNTVFAPYPMPMVDMQDMIKLNTFHLEEKA